MSNDKFQKSISIVLFFTLISILWFCTAANVVSAAEIEEKPKQGLLGDINGDGVIDYKDYVKLYRRVNCLPLGDINKDGVVDEEDYNLLYNYVKNPDEYPLSDEQKLCADINGDGYVNVMDYTILYRYVKGLIDSLPEESTESLNVDLNADGDVDNFDVNILNDIINTLENL